MHTVDELKPCPFCDSANVKAYNLGTHLAFVCCNDCQGINENHNDPIAAWNRRSVPQAVPQAAIDAAVAAERDRIADACWERRGHFASDGAARAFAELVRAGKA